MFGCDSVGCVAALVCVLKFLHETFLETFVSNAYDVFHFKTDVVKRALVPLFEMENACICFIQKHELINVS